MTIFTILETLLIGPLKLIFENIFGIAYGIVMHQGLSIIFLSLVMNILVLPLYRRADVMQEEVRNKEAKIHDGVEHIKKTFSGDERMMILQTYYRQNDYKPTDILNGSISLFMQIPFFMAAYQFLSNLNTLHGASLGPIKDLGAPDGLLVIGGVAINLLPILMTLINMVSCILYTKGFPLKTKIQLYGMALFFLVFLYSSPSGLVFYWTLNNVFSLVKNIFYKLKNPKKVVRILCAVVSLFFFICGIHFFNSGYFSRSETVTVFGVLLLLPVITPIFKKNVQIKEIETPPNQKLFKLGTIFLTILMGILIPSALIAASPQDFVNLLNFKNPLWHIVRSFCMAAGTFLIWLRVFYWLAVPKIKRLFDYLVWIVCGVALVDYLFFGTDLGVITSSLKYEDGLYFSTMQNTFNLVIIMLVAAILFFCACKWKRIAVNVLIISIFTLGTMSARNLVKIKTSIDSIADQQISGNETPTLPFSTTGKNVVVFMLDRAVGGHIPYIFDEKPELKEKFDGFTFYENTISYGAHTNFASPALYGGYEYTPVELNKRSDMSLVSKHNESLKVMPTIFAENGYQVTVCDPPYVNYDVVPNISIFKDCPGVTAHLTSGWIDGTNTFKSSEINIFSFSVMKSLPLLLQPFFYDQGRYLQVELELGESFLNEYNVMDNLSKITEVTEDSTNTFLCMTNRLTHEAILLQKPDYTPSTLVDNSQYDAEHNDTYMVDGRQLNMQTNSQITHYHVNMASMILLGNWFDYLRENNVYDNTRIILVSDHGRDLHQLDELLMGSDDLPVDIEYYYPLLMVKDFNSKGFVTSDTFMTNADVPTLAMEELIEQPINPFTGKIINDDEKYAHDQFVILSHRYEVDLNNGNTFLPSEWAQVNDNMWDRDNWTFYEELTVLDENSPP